MEEKLPLSVSEAPVARLQLSFQRKARLLEHFVYLTCDDHDVANITKGEKILVSVAGGDKYSPYSVRGIAHGKIPEIKQNLADSDIVFIIAGLGGTVGSGLAPLVAREARAKGAVTVAGPGDAVHL